MSITIEGKEYDIIPFSHTIVLNDDDLIILRPVKQPTFSVGMRVESYYETTNFTEGMVYRIVDKSVDGFYLIDDMGEINHFEKPDIYFTPYEKPKEGEKCWYIDGTEDTSIDEYDWSNNSLDNNLWNLGLAFKTKEQATFARERLSKLF